MDSTDLSRAAWRKSSRTVGQGQCVEVAFLDPAVAVRDSKNPTGPALVYTSAQWDSFLTSIKTGQFDQS